MEYDELYNEYKICGFEFKSNKGHLGKSIPLTNTHNVDHGKSNNDEVCPIFIKCSNCDEYMIYTEGHQNCCDGKWTCPKCGQHVNETSVMKKLERENNNFLNDNDLF